MAVAKLVPPPSVPRSIFRPSRHSTPWLVPPGRSLKPTMSPWLLMAVAPLLVPPRVPRSTIRPLCQRNAWRADIAGPTLLSPTTTPWSLSAVASLQHKSPRVPRSTIRNRVEAPAGVASPAARPATTMASRPIHGFLICCPLVCGRRSGSLVVQRGRGIEADGCQPEGVGSETPGFAQVPADAVGGVVNLDAGRDQPVPYLVGGREVAGSPGRGAQFEQRLDERPH